MGIAGRMSRYKEGLGKQFVYNVLEALLGLYRQGVLLLVRMGGELFLIF